MASAERLSGVPLSDVTVHRNSPEPTRLGAHAYAQGAEIHIAPGQEHHLPHELWHVVQQRQGRVGTTTHVAGRPVNDAPDLEREAGTMGEQAARAAREPALRSPPVHPVAPANGDTVRDAVVQRVTINGRDGSLGIMEAVALIRSNIQGFPYKYRDYINDDEFITFVVKEIDAWQIEYETDESFFQMVRDDIDRHAAHQLEQEDMVPELKPLTIGLPAVSNPFFNRVDPVELRRQVQGQVGGLNAMTVGDWLRNVLLNRMKSIDVIIGNSVGTKRGTVLANTINDWLYKDDNVARFALDAVLSNLNRLVDKYADYAASPFIAQLYQAALIAREAPKGVYVTFEQLDGMRMMEDLNRMGMEGGFGREHGLGDERWFRSEFLDGVELVKAGGGTTFEKNAILHNPDQCVGGDMEVADEELEALIQARNRFRDASRRMLDLHGTINAREQDLSRVVDDHENYDARLPRWQATQKIFNTVKIPSQQELEQRAQSLTAHIDQLKEEADSLLEEIDRSSEDYRRLMLPHIGSYDVNSLLGRQWMEPVSGGSSPSRVELLLEGVRQFISKKGMDALDSMRMDVRYTSADDLSSIASNDTPFLIPNIDFLRNIHQATVEQSASFGKKQKELLGNASTMSRQTQPSMYSALKGQGKNNVGTTLGNLRHFFNVGYASGAGMNCLIRSVLRANGQQDTDGLVRQIRQDAMDLGLVGEADMFDLSDGGGAAVLQEIEAAIGGGYILNVIQVHPGNGTILSRDRITVGDGAGGDVYILHLGNHFTPLFLKGGGLDAWLAGNNVPTTNSQL